VKHIYSTGVIYDHYLRSSKYFNNTDHRLLESVLFYRMCPGDMFFIDETCVSSNPFFMEQQSNGGMYEEDWDRGILRKRVCPWPDWLTCGLYYKNILMIVSDDRKW